MGETPNIFSALGLVVPLCVAMKNAILQVDRTIDLRRRGREVEQALMERLVLLVTLIGTPVAYFLLDRL